MSENEVSPEFIAEAQEIVDALNRDLIAVEKEIRDDGEIDPDLINTLFRSAHSLKGISGMFGLEEIAGLSHEMESVLDGMRLGRVTVDASALDVPLTIGNKKLIESPIICFENSVNALVVEILIIHSEALILSALPDAISLNKPTISITRMVC